MQPLKRYSEEEAKAGMELAVAVGRRQAVKRLGISNSTFQKWTQKYPQFWSDLRAGDPDQQRQGFATSLIELAQEGMALEHKLIHKAEDMVDTTSDPKEVAALLKATAASRQAATVGARTVLGEADVVEHNVNFPQIEQAMERILSLSKAQPLQITNEAESDGP